MTNVLDIEQELTAQRQIVKDLEAALLEAKRESPDKELAKTLHGMLCQWNHTDGCSWYYETKAKQDDWTGYTHGVYLAKAQKLIGKCNEHNIDPADAVEMFRLVKGI